VVSALSWLQSSPQECLYNVGKLGNAPALGNEQSPNAGRAATYGQHLIDQELSTFRDTKIANQ